LRYFIEIAYHGKNYHGWQSQPQEITVQEVLEEALSTVLREDVSVVGAGRTDSGVHAKQLFAHFDIEETVRLDNLVFRLNSFLPEDISAKNVLHVANDAHARFDAVAREYEYKISFSKNPFLQGLAHKIHHCPDIPLMNQAADVLLSNNDFQCFSRSNTGVKTYFCKLEKAVWTLHGTELKFTITADRFLRNMVRAIVGTLLDVGFKKTSLAELEEIIKSKDRKRAGTSAPAHGLYLTRVVYPDHVFKPTPDN